MAWTNNTLVEHRLTEDEQAMLSSSEGNPTTVSAILKDLTPGEYVVACTARADSNPEVFNRYLQELRESGINVGKGTEEYGFRRPSPSRGASNRKLIIFRRR